MIPAQKPAWAFDEQTDELGIAPAVPGVAESGDNAVAEAATASEQSQIAVATGTVAPYLGGGLAEEKGKLEGTYGGAETVYGLLFYSITWRNAEGQTGYVSGSGGKAEMLAKVQIINPGMAFWFDWATITTAKGPTPGSVLAVPLESGTGWFRSKNGSVYSYAGATPTLEAGKGEPETYGHGIVSDKDSEILIQVVVLIVLVSLVAGILGGVGG